MSDQEGTGVRMYDLAPETENGVTIERIVCVDLHDQTGNVYLLERALPAGDIPGWSRIEPVESHEAVKWLQLYIAERSVATNRELRDSIDLLTKRLGGRKSLRRLLRQRRR